MRTKEGDGINRVHIVRYWPCGGGMERIIRIHLERAEPVIVLFGSEASEHGVHFLELSHNSLIGTAKRRLAKILKLYTGSHFLFYNGYGLDWLEPARIPGRAILYLHSDYTGFNSWLLPLLPYAHGCLCVNSRLAEKVSHLGDGAPVAVVPLPVGDEFLANNSNVSSTGPIRIGYSGRVVVDQKRLDRLGDFVSALELAGLDFQIEILGDGEYLDELAKTFAGNARIVLRGFLTGDEYRETMRRWKYIFFMSDYEGLPISLIEGVACGCLPVYPDFHNDNDWIDPLASNSYYPVGDMDMAAKIVIRAEFDMTQSEWEDFHIRARQLVSGHSIDAYFQGLEEGLQETRNFKPERKIRKTGVSAIVPVWCYNRLRTHRLRKQDQATSQQ